MQNIYWDLLNKNQEEFKKRRIETLFEEDNNRFSKFSISIEDLFFDFSKTNIDLETLLNLRKFAEKSEILRKVDSMFKGDKINITDNRSVLHTALRNFNTKKRQSKWIAFLIYLLFRKINYLTNIIFCVNIFEFVDNITKYIPLEKVDASQTTL